MSEKYYYLVASLPPLKLDNYKGPYRVKEFVEELKENLYPGHYDLVQDVLGMNDHHYIVDVLLARQSTGLSGFSNFSFEAWGKNLQNPDFTHRDYIAKFLKETEQAKKEDKDLCAQYLENLIEKYFYQKMLKSENYFIREYFKFNFELKNIVLALNKRKFNITNAELLDLENESGIIDELKTSKSGDFNLTKEVDYLAGLIDAFGKEDLVYFEKYLDLLRWKKIDEINMFSYFEIDQLLGYLIKLILVERWIALQAKKGHEIFKTRTKIDVEQVFN